MEECPVRYISATAYCHATEDCGKVAKALTAVVPGAVSVEELAGYHGNKIIALRVKVEGCAATEIFSNILKLFDDLDFEIFINSLEIFKNKVYIRLNKQKAYTGALRLDAGDDVVHVEVRFSRKALNDLIRVLRELRGPPRHPQEGPKRG